MRFAALGLVFVLLSAASDAAVESGAQVYQRLCASCHGAKGEGVADKYDEPLYGERTLASLARYIDRTMPEDEPEKCSPEEAQRVAEYIFHAFYSEEARLRNNPPKRAAQRLTNRQLRESVADLFGSFGPQKEAALPPQPAQGVGLKAQYFESKQMNKQARHVFDRVDEKIDFDFGEDAPVEGIDREQFAVSWEGSLAAPETGMYEFRVKTPNGVRFYLNTSRKGERIARDDSVSKRESPLIDAWVSSGAEVREVSGRIFLLGGRRYPLRLDYFKYKEKRGAVRLEWKPPHGAWGVLSAPDIVPTGAPRVVVVGANLPADDRSAGYERGTSVSKEWHEAVTKAAIDAAAHVPKPEDAAKAKEAVTQLATRAFRRPLTPKQRALYVDRHFAGNLPPEVAAKRAVIAIVQSPRFLFPELGAPADDFTTATRLALALWDSVPDDPLTDAAAKGELRTREQLHAQAERMSRDPRTKAKLAQFFDHWLTIDDPHEVTKDPKLFPGFDEAVMADLRRSLQLFVEQVVSSEGADYRELITADYVMLNERLAKFYGTRVEGAGFQRVALDPQQRAGVITHPFLLSTFAHAKASSPVHRGVFLTRNVLGRLLKPPPNEVEFDADHLDPKFTMRQRITELTKKETCMSCHATINPLGFSLEAFDAAGRFRATENGKPVDVAADYTTVDGKVIKLRGARNLAQHIVGSADARGAFVRHLFNHLSKNEPGAYGSDALDRLNESFTKSNTHIRKLVVEIAIAAALPPSPKTTASR